MLVLFPVRGIGRIPREGGRALKRTPGGEEGTMTGVGNRETVIRGGSLFLMRTGRRAQSP